jgi:hypothetical protein
MKCKSIKSINPCSPTKLKDNIVNFSRKYVLLILLTLQCSFAYAQSTYPETVISDDGSEWTDDSNQFALVWPVLPGESVKDIAVLFYPKNKIMQQRFVAKTLKLSYAVNPNLSPTTTSDQESMIVIPNIKTLGGYSGKIKAKSSKSIDSATEAKLELYTSYAVEGDGVYEFSPKLQAIYDSLVKRNAQFKQGLAELNSRLANLQQKLAALKVELIRIVDHALSITETQTKIAKQAREMVAKNNAAASNHFNGTTAKFTNDSSPFPAKINTANNENEQAQYSLTKLLMPALLLILVVSSFLYIRRYLSNYHPISSANANLKGKKANTTKPNVNNHEVVEYVSSLPLTEDLQETESEFSGSIPGLDANAGDDLEQKKAADTTLEQAKIYANVSRFKEAIMLLKTQIQETPKVAIHHWFYLLDLYRKSNEKDEFLSNAKQLHEKFNVMPPQWDKSEFPVLAASSIEELPHIVERLTSLWATEGRLTENMTETKAYLDELLMDNRFTERMGFSVDVFQDILLLRDLLDMRLKLALDGLS